MSSFFQHHWQVVNFNAFQFLLFSALAAHFIVLYMCCQIGDSLSQFARVLSLSLCFFVYLHVIYEVIRNCK